MGLLDWLDKTKRNVQGASWMMRGNLPSRAALEKGLLGMSQPFTKESIEDPAAMEAAMAFGMAGILGKGNALTKFEKAHKIAQKNAAKPVSEGGLGLPKDNTAMDRARAMGFVEEGFHGSVYDIKNFDPRKASTESHAGRGTYITDSARDASENYASIYGGDVQGKVVQALEQSERHFPRSYKALQDKNLTPRQQEVLLSQIGADNAGVVYPLMYRTKKAAHLDNPAMDPFIPPAERYLRKTDEFVPSKDAGKWQKAIDEFQSIGGNVDHLYDYGLLGEGGRASDIYKAIQKGSDYLEDASGNLVSGGVAAGDFLRHFGVDTIKHTPQFKNQQLNLGNTHTIVMKPNQIRSRFAAFDPRRKYEDDLLAAYFGVPLNQE